MLNTTNLARFITTAALVAVVGMAVGFVLIGAQERPGAQAQTPPGAQAQAPRADVVYHRDFESIGEMLAEQDAVAVLGRVTSEAVTVRVGRGVLFTDTRVEVDEVLHGIVKTDHSESAWVRQTGGTENSETLVLNGQKLLASGETVLLVLTYDEVFDRYFIVGGAHGYFVVDGDDMSQPNLSDPDHALVTRRADGEHPLAKLARTTDADAFRVALRAADPD